MPIRKTQAGPMKSKLTTTDRELCAMVARVAFANPFGAEREALDRRIAGVDAQVDRNELFARAVNRIDAVLRRLIAGNLIDLRLYSGEEREVMRTVCLFEVYHRLRGAFDDFIQQQIAAGDTPCQVPFAREVFSILAERGLNSEEIPRYFAIFYQMRRAFYFIETTLIGLSPSMHTLRLHLWNSIFTSDIGRYENLLWDRMEDFSTLLLGETGTGKGAAAAAIGRSGFIPFDERKGCFSESFTRNFIQSQPLPISGDH